MSQQWSTDDSHLVALYKLHMMKITQVHHSLQTSLVTRNLHCDQKMCINLKLTNCLACRPKTGIIVSVSLVFGVKLLARMWQEIHIAVVIWSTEDWHGCLHHGDKLFSGNHCLSFCQRVAPLL